MRRRNSIGEQFVAHRRDMRESPAWRFLPDNARRVLDRLELEHMRHGSADNGSLPCTYTDFEEAGIRRKSVALAIRQCVALGFLEITRPGRRSIAEFRTPSLYRLTYLHGLGKSPDPSDEWKRYDTDERARAALAVCERTRTHPNAQRQRQSSDAHASAGAHAPAMGSVSVSQGIPTRDLECRGENAPRTVGAKTPPAPRVHKGR